MRMPPLPADSIHARACKLKCEKILTRPVCRAQGVSVIGRHSHTCSLMCIQIEHQTRLTLSGLVLTLEFAMWRGCKVTYDMQQRQYG